MLTIVDDIDKGRTDGIEGLLSDLADLIEEYSSKKRHCHSIDHNPSMCDIIALGCLQKHTHDLRSRPECQPPYSNLCFQQLTKMVMGFTYPDTSYYGRALHPPDIIFCNTNSRIKICVHNREKQLGKEHNNIMMMQRKRIIAQRSSNTCR